MAAVPKWHPTLFSKLNTFTTGVKCFEKGCIHDAQLKLTWRFNYATEQYTDNPTCARRCAAGHYQAAPRGAYAVQATNDLIEASAKHHNVPSYESFILESWKAAQAEQATKDSKSDLKESEADMADESTESPGLGDALWSQFKPKIQREIARESKKAARDAILEKPMLAAKIEWTVNDKPLATHEGVCHKVLPEIIKRRAAGIGNFFLYGPSGSGKTRIAEDLAKALAKPFASISCTAGMSESAIVGKATHNIMTKEVGHELSEIMITLRDGGVALIDEIDGGDANTLLVLNSLASNYWIHIPGLGKIERHPESILLGGANTTGNGASRQYVGRNQLDAAFMSRFAGGMVAVDYDRDMELLLVGNDTEFCQRVWKLRDTIANVGLRQIIGTRELLSAAKLYKSGLYKAEEAIAILTTAWTMDEKQKAGLA